MHCCRCLKLDQMCLPQKRKNHCIAVIGDGAITGGMAYEAMNHAGYLDKNMIVILNDNQQVLLDTDKLWRGILCCTSGTASSILIGSQRAQQGAGLMLPTSQPLSPYGPLRPEQAWSYCRPQLAQHKMTGISATFFTHPAGPPGCQAAVLESTT